MEYQQFHDQALLEAMLDAIQATFGQHPGYRHTHAKGVVATGTFTASAAAARISRGEHFQGKTVPVSLRFSNFSGIPQTVDADHMARPHGLGIRYHLDSGSETDLVAHSFDGFPTATPEDFLMFLQGIAASLSAQSPDPAPLERFLSTHESARQYLSAVNPVPKSYTTLPYFGVNAFRLVAPDGALSTGRYRIEPAGSEEYYSEKQLSGLSNDYLSEELASRLHQGPVSMRLIFQLAGADDDTADCSVAWPRTGPAAREEILLGEFSIEALATDNAEVQRALALDPCRLVDGVMQSDDPMLPARSALYHLAASRRREKSA